MVLLAALLALAVVPTQAVITLDETAGTNMVGNVTSSMTTVGGWILPIVAAIIMIGGALGIYRALARKGKVQT